MVFLVPTNEKIHKSGFCIYTPMHCMLTDLETYCRLLEALSKDGDSELSEVGGGFFY